MDNTNLDVLEPMQVYLKIARIYQLLKEYLELLTIMDL